MCVNVCVTLYVCCLFCVSASTTTISVQCSLHTIPFVICRGPFFVLRSFCRRSLFFSLLQLVLSLSQWFYTNSLEFWWSANSQNNFAFTCFIISTVLSPLIIAINWIRAGDQKTANRNNNKNTQFCTVHSLMCEFFVFNFIRNRSSIIKEWTFAFEEIMNLQFEVKTSKIRSRERILKLDLFEALISVRWAERFLHSRLIMVIPQIGGKHCLIGHKTREKSSDTHPDKSDDYDPFACICKIA